MRKENIKACFNKGKGYIQDDDPPRSRGRGTEAAQRLDFLWEGVSAAGLIWPLVVDGEVEERDQRGAGVPTGGSPVRLHTSTGAAAHSQVSGQRDLDLKPHLPVLRRPEEQEIKEQLLEIKEQDSTPHLMVFHTLDLVDVAYVRNQNPADL